MKWSLQSTIHCIHQVDATNVDAVLQILQLHFARAFDCDGHFDVINSAKGGKYAKSSQLAMLAENKGFRYSGALLMQIVSSHFIVLPIATYMKQLRGCSLFAKLLDFRVIWSYLFETEDEVKI